MTTQQIVNLLTRYGFIIIAVTVTVIGWISRYVKAQKREQAAKRAKELRELESLRTGRYEAAPERVSAAPPSAQASLEEIAARRRAKIEEIQRRRSPGSPSVSAPPTRMPPGQALEHEIGRVLGQILGVPGQSAPSGRPAGQQPVQPARRPMGGPTNRPSTRPQQRGTPAQRPQAPSPRPQPASQRSASQRRAADSSSDHASVQKMSQAKLAPQHDQNAPAYSYATGDAGKNQANKDAASGRWKRQSTVGGLNLRRLFLMREVFEKPVSMREDSL